MRLNDVMPSSFVYEGVEYYIDLTFDNVLDVFDITSRDDLFDIEKVHLGLAMYLGDVEIEDPVGIWNYINSELIQKGQRKPIQYDILGNVMPDIEEDEDIEEYFNLVQDADLIYASFVAEYGIDLIEQQGKMHWYKFQSLLQGLSSDCILQRVIQIRLWKPQKGDSSDYKQSMRKLQNYYRLVTD